MAKAKAPKPGQNPPGRKKGSITQMKDEVVALGGTAEDLALFEGLDSGSESEIEGVKLNDKKLTKDVQKLVKELGLEKARLRDASESEADVSSTSQEDVMPENQRLENGKKIPRFIFLPQAEWHAAQLPELPRTTRRGSSHASISNLESTERLKKFAKELLHQENELYASSKSSKSSAHQFYLTVMSSGTLSDKISALTLSVQESPVHNVRAMDALVGLARKRSRAQAVDVLGALKDLFAAGSLLPADRRLRTFAAQPGLEILTTKELEKWQPDQPLPAPLQKIHLVSWAYEDWLKTTYFEVLKILESWCDDEVVFARSKAVDYVFELLRDKPEQETNLLRLLVNKLGDSEKRVASRTSYNILQLQKPHPRMKLVIISAIESDVLFRAGQTMHAKYYAVITLNQTVLDHTDQVVRKLLDIYFALFLSLLAKSKPVAGEDAKHDRQAYNAKGERQGGGGKPGKKAKGKLAAQLKSTAAEDQLRERMLSAILTGINRAFPFLNDDDNFFENHLDTLFRVTHSSNFNTSIQALVLIHQLCDFQAGGFHQATLDRFYRTLYESLLDPRLLTTSKQAMYLNLLYRALKQDTNVKRVIAFGKRLLQIATIQQPPFACASLYLIGELQNKCPNLKTLVDQPEEESAEMETFELQNGKSSPFYDGRKRDPQHSNAQRSCLWELNPYLSHFHPSVRLFAARILNHQELPPKPELSMHSLSNFLDHFARQHAKKPSSGLRGDALMQPLKGADERTLFVPGRLKGEMPANPVRFWKMDVESVEPSQVFLHTYYGLKGKGKEAADKKKKQRKNDGVGDTGSGEEEEDAIWKALVNSKPEIDDGGEISDDLDMDGLESAMEDESDQGMDGQDFSGNSDGPDFSEDDAAFIDSDDESLLNDDATGNQNTSDRGDSERPSKKRKRLKSLPTFASVEDYAAMLQDDD